MSLKRPTQEYVLTEAKIDTVKSNVCKITLGSYTGNGTQNRDVAHGAYFTPSVVFIARRDGNGLTFWITGQTGETPGIYPANTIGEGTGIISVDGTNVRVGGDATGLYFNTSAVVYDMVVIG